MALKAQHCGDSAREAIESWRSSYQPKRVDRPSPLADAAIRAWRESYPPARREQQSTRRSLEAAARVKTFFGHHADPTLRPGADAAAAAAIAEFRKNYRG